MEFGNTQTLNAKIKFSFLGVSDALCFQLGFDTQGGTTYKTDFIPADVDLITRLLNTLELHSWEELPRKFARIQVSGYQIKAIGNLIENKWIQL